MVGKGKLPPRPLAFALAFDDIYREQSIARLAVSHRIALTNRIERVHAADNLAEDGVLTVQMRRRTIRNEELRAISVGARVRHRQDAGPIMLEGQRARLVPECIAGATATCAGGITSLHHETMNDAMEGRIIVKAVARQKHEIVDGNGCLGREQFDLDIASGCMQDRRVLLRRIDLHGRWLMILSGQNKTSLHS